MVSRHRDGLGADRDLVKRLENTLRDAENLILRLNAKGYSVELACNQVNVGVFGQWYSRHNLRVESVHNSNTGVWLINPKYPQEKR